MLSEEEINKILIEELGRVGSLGGVPENASYRVRRSRKAGRSGAMLAARFLKTQSYHANFKIDDVNKSVATVVSSYFDNQPGEVLSNGSRIYKKVVGSGFFKMNPTVLIAIISANDVQLAGYAKEGLIKQHSAEKAVKSLLNILQQ